MINHGLAPKIQALGLDLGFLGIELSMDNWFVQIYKYLPWDWVEWISTPRIYFDNNLRQPTNLLPGDLDVPNINVTLLSWSQNLLPQPHWYPFEDLNIFTFSVKLMCL